MKIACLYFPTSSVGGIATNTASLRNEAKRRGDTFHVLVCDNVERHMFETMSKPKRIRGGDTYIDVDGYCSHHKARRVNSAAQLNKYDLVYTAYLCPHPTKAYGDVPEFLELLRLLTKPLVGHITDGYYSTYKEWGDQTAALCARTIVDQPAYVPPGYAEAHPTTVIPFGPFDPVGPGYSEPDSGRSEGRTLAWIAQWKNIKGVHQFFDDVLPKFEGVAHLFSNGIEYYYIRDTPEWEELVGRDHYREKMKQTFEGTGRHTFYGWQPLDVVQKALETSWFTVEFQGMGKPKFEAYRNGSLNHTIIEALYYGCTPVIPQITIDYAGVPPEAAIGVRDYVDAVPALNGDRASRPDLGKQWVLDNFAVSGIYDKMFGGIL